MSNSNETGKMKSTDMYLKNIKATLDANSIKKKKLPLIQQLNESNSKQLSLPWFDDVGLQSSSLVKGSLFSACSRGKRELRENVAIPMQGNLIARVTGAELRQDEATILAKLIDLTKNQPLTERFYFYPGVLLSQLNWSTSSSNYAKLYNSLSLMRGTVITIAKIIDNQQLVHLQAKTLLAELDAKISIPNSGRNRDQWSIQLEPTLAELYQRNNVTLFDWDIRYKITKTKSDVALWLFSYLTEFDEPKPIPLSFLRTISGLGNMSTGAANQAFKRGCEILISCGFLEKYILKDGLLLVKRLKPQRKIGNKSSTPNHPNVNKTPSTDDFNEEFKE
ncbi:plasmid replication initiator TrfA [Iodobacter sp. CM08]|uniref:plasmid replication initiator TrfA n=1 Tax=Iodobacter sp. CM08 TaxID=3085902 RepID=UPI002980D52A|nr:plasmid replication initiator TrfA [Iodobacter sp. CM08]MDW5419077.1 plasmid replication initiator TrfA [Iodobacter sp. CM08]